MSKITRSAKGENCTVRIPGVCNFNTETTVLAHLNGAGIGMKHEDIFGAYCCSSCHLVLDGHVGSEYDSETLRLWHYDGVIRTQKILLDKGLIDVK